MPDHVHLKSHHQSVALTDMYLHGKNNFITPIVFEILKLEKPAFWFAESIFAFNHAHLKLHDQPAALIDTKLHVKNELYTSISFWDVKVLKASLDVPDHTHLNLHNQ